VPQFINPLEPQLPQYFLIAATLCLTDICVMSGYALAAVRLGRWLRDPKAIAYTESIVWRPCLFLPERLLAFSSRPT
jgi:homoserine/homoserine lactone efflux protein